jgi:hypothetical protein
MIKQILIGLLAATSLQAQNIVPSWTSRTYTTSPVTDSVRIVCASTCVSYATGALTILRTQNSYIVFSATGTGTIEICCETTPLITLTPSTRYQTITGWEATAQAGQSYAGWTGEALDSSVALGINRLRLEIKSGTENPVAGGARYAPVNDNNDPNVANLTAFRFSTMDSIVDAVVNPMRTKLAAKGEALYVNLNYVSFGNTTPNFHATTGAEYAELMLVTFQHLQSKYGWTPDGIEVILEPDNGTSWTGTMIGNAIAATGTRLAAAGFHPEFISPSVMNMSNGVPFLNAIVAVPGASTYLREVAYHRYSNPGDWNLTQIRNRAMALGLRMAMLEHIGSGIDDLLTDLTTGNNSAWQQYTLAWPGTDNGGHYFGFNGTTPVAGIRTKALREVFSNVHRGAIRIGSTSTDPTIITAAFINTDQSFVSLVRLRAANTINITGLPAGRYKTSFTTDSGTTTSNIVVVTNLLTIPISSPGILSVVQSP